MGKDHTKPQTIPFKLIINPLIVLQEKLYVLLNMGLGRRTSIILMVATLLLVSSSLTLTGAVQSEFGAGGKDKPSQKVKVTIRNSLGGGVWAGLHCKSKNDDLGRTYLSPNKGFDFSFSPNFWGTTLFYCHVTWKWPGNSQSHFFDAYSFGRDSDRCKPAPIAAVGTSSPVDPVPATTTIIVFPGNNSIVT